MFSLEIGYSVLDIGYSDLFHKAGLTTGAPVILALYFTLDIGYSVLDIGYSDLFRKAGLTTGAPGILPLCFTLDIGYSNYCSLSYFKKSTDLQPVFDEVHVFHVAFSGNNAIARTRIFNCHHA